MRHYMYAAVIFTIPKLSNNYFCMRYAGFYALKMTGVSTMGFSTSKTFSTSLSSCSKLIRMTNGVKTHWRGGIRMYPIHISLLDLTYHLHSGKCLRPQNPWSQWVTRRLVIFQFFLHKDRHEKPENRTPAPTLGLKQVRTVLVMGRPKLAPGQPPAQTAASTTPAPTLAQIQELQLPVKKQVVCLHVLDSLTHLLRPQAAGGEDSSSSLAISVCPVAHRVSIIMTNILLTDTTLVLACQCFLSSTLSPL